MNVAKLAKRGLFLAGVLSISAASAFAQSVETVPYQEGFDTWSEGLVNGQNKLGWTVQADDASSITNIGGTAGKVLSLNTEGQTLQLDFDETDPDTQALGSTIWVDALVKMVISEDDPASIPNDVRTALFLNASSNLVIYHGVAVNESGTWGVVATNDATSVELSPDSWYRLTIETYGNENAQFFKYYINGTPVEGAAGVAYSEIPESFDTPASNNGVWFPAAMNTGLDAKVEALAFQGTGYVDDISVSKDSPLQSFWQLTVDATSNGSIRTNGVELAERTHDISTAASITLVATPATGYAVASFTTNGVAVGASSVVFADMAAGAEVEVAATFALQPAAVVDANGDVIAYYDSLEDALAAIAVNGGSIKLFDNVVLTDWILVENAVTLDLNGHTITRDAANWTTVSPAHDAIVAIKHGGSFTLNDSSDPSTGAIGSASDTLAVGIKMTIAGDIDDTNAATLVVNGGTIYGYYYGISGNGSAGRGNTSVTINGGNIYGTCPGDNVGIFNPQAGTLTINGGYIEGDTGIWIKSGTCTCSVDGGTIVGTGAQRAYVTSQNGFNGTGDAFVVDNVGYPGGAPAPSILGGTFVSSNGVAVASYANSTHTPVAGFVAGGTFNTPVPVDLCAAGYVPVDNGDGTYGVVEADYVAQIGSVKYESLAAAVAAAQSGDTVMLLTNVTLTARVEPNLGANTTLTIDLGGNTITREGTSGNGSVFDVKSGSVVITNGVIDCTQDDTAIVADGVYAITSRSGSDVTLAGLTITVDSECGACAYPFAGSTLTIKSGTYSNVTTTPYRYKPEWTGMAINQPNNATQALFIEGGTFSQVDPRLGDDAGQMESFVADGFISVADNGAFSIIPGATITYVSDHGTAPAAKDVAFVNGSYTLVAADLPDLSDEGWTFDGWDKEIGDVISANTTITASWTEVVTPQYPNSAKAGDGAYVIVDPLDGATEQLAFGAPVTAANGDVTVPFSAEIIGTGTINSGLYLKVKTELAGAYSTIPAVITVDATEGTGTATFTPPAGATQLFFFGITDTAIAGE